ncbi:general transcription factor IIF subunit 1-like [Macrosteles quadrilineatus]|uniref:general transcription factor IIF subunit 1-like n=1 Tax=Macrosteles quadrilineatus TaxID=74068 RepID=UPI0023E1DE22|nr:general transcription factor IIF subunit 1-like [Macrosteles quadrilineatus]
MSSLKQTSMSASQSSQATPAQEFSIRVPKASRKRHHVMRFNSVLNVDFAKWGPVKMERENNAKEFARPDDDMPKFGAGSEYGREAKEEARRKKFGIVSKKYKPEDQPWILKAGGKTGKKFKGIREGGVGENAAYYVFTHAADGAIDAYPLCEWYNFQPINRYKSLSAEEAEQEFGRRNKVINYFSLMLRKRLRNDEDGDLDEEEGKTKRGNSKKSKDFKISDMDDWMNTDDDDSEEDEDNDDEEKKEKKKKKQKNDKNKKNAAKKKKKGGSDDSAVEESDDGDEEGRELDYISDSSDSDSDHEAKIDKDMKGVAEESALRRLLSSGEEDEEDEEDKEKKSEADDKEDEDKEKSGKKKKKATKKEKEEKEAKAKADENDESSSEFNAESSDSDADNKAKTQQNSASSSRCTSPATQADKRAGTSLEGSAAKKARLEPLPLNFNSSDSGITEDAVRRYLMRKPMSTTELLQKFKSKKTGLTSEQLVNVMTQLLKKINPHRQTIKGKMFFSLKPV